MPHSRWRLGVRQNVLVNAGLLALLTLVIVVITSLYISRERNFHWWIDWYYPTVQIAKTFWESPSEALGIIQASLARERNRLHTLPLLPFIWVFGDSRLVYEIALALVYLLPFSLVMGAIATQLIRVHRQSVFWATAFLTVLIPVSWVTTFMGIPDTGGAVFIGLATFFYLQDVRLKTWWRIPAIGLCIGAAILLRRPFVYAGLTVLAAISVQALLFFAAEVRKHPQLAWRNLLEYGVRVGLIALVAFATLWTVARDFTYHAMTVDYRTLYTSWSLPFNDIANLYASFYGWGTWLMVAIGFSAAILTRSLPLSAISILGLSGVFSLIIWVGILRYGNIFYSLQVTPFVVIGLVAFIWTSWVSLQGRTRQLMLSGIGCYLIVNFVLGLTPIGQFDNAFRPLFAVSNPPLVRQDYDQVVKLIDYLRQLTPNKEPIYIVGNQRLQMDTSLLRAAELLLYGRDNRKLNILQAPLVDSRDTYPFESLLKAQYVVVPNPLPDYPKRPGEAPVVGEWLPHQEIDVVNVVFDAFAQNWEFVQDFQRLPVQFTLEKGAVASIYQRIRPTSLTTALQTLYAIQQRMDERPGSQLNWIGMSQPLDNSFVAFANRNKNNTYRLVTLYRDRTLDMVANSTVRQALPRKRDRAAVTEEPTLAHHKVIQVSSDDEKLSMLEKSLERTQRGGTAFLYLGLLPENAEVTGAITYLDKQCVKSSVRATMLDKQGQIISSTDKEYNHVNGISRFKLSIAGEEPAYLLLDVMTYDKNERMNACTLTINALSVSAKKY